EVLEHPALAADPRFTRNASRVEHRAALNALVEPLLLARTVADWVARLDAAGIPAGPIYSVAQALQHEQVRARGMVAEVAHPTAGTIGVTGVPVRLSDTPGSVRTAPPLLGEHTESLLRDVAGLDPATIRQLAADGIIAT